MTAPRRKEIPIASTIQGVKLFDEETDFEVDDGGREAGVDDTALGVDCTGEALELLPIVSKLSELQWSKVTKEISVTGRTQSYPPQQAHNQMERRSVWFALQVVQSLLQTQWLTSQSGLHHC